MLRLKDLMQQDVVAVSPDLTLRELIEVLREQAVSGVPVVTAGKVVGVISTTDIFDLKADAAPRPGGPLDDGPRRNPGAPGSEFFTDPWESSEPGADAWLQATQARDRDFLDVLLVSDVMTPKVISQPSNTPVKKAAGYMLETGVHRILIIDRGELRGIVTTTDIMRAVAEGRLKG